MAWKRQHLIFGAAGIVALIGALSFALQQRNSPSPEAGSLYSLVADNEAGSVTMPGASQPMLSTAALFGVDAREALDLALQWADEGRNVQSWITHGELRFSFPTGEEIPVEFPEGKALLAVAPYIGATHPCSEHFLSSCRGELPSLSFDVTVKMLDGTEVASGTYTTATDGFFYIWLPADITARLEVTGVRGSGTATIDTTSGSDTCITNLQLS